ncbi:hydrolase [Aliidiomarina soli]|uniref:Hydrolase n=1 Tax=Aliidiomarina soli TaxID=1928574 RepID=A0A432WIQ8_9GAMM|nr:hydrolase [Aliidiomarina soli]RUO33712.1 hydrolase [Aliidiomarina soli]
MKHAALINRHSSFLLLIDIQQRLAPAIADSQAIIERNSWLLQVAAELDVPAIVTEQYPQGLGHTVSELTELVKAAEVMEKTHFSAFAEDDIATCLKALKRPQVILTGTETHVCVLQTALDMQAAGFQIFVVADAVGSRNSTNKELALQRMRDAGCVVVSSEMVAFEWLQQSATDEFRHISKTYIR